MRAYSDGDRQYGNEQTATEVDAVQGTLVLSGTAVTEATSSSIDVASGEVAFGGSPQTVSTESGVDLSPLPSTDNVRYDVITRDDTDGTVAVTTGTEGSVGTAVSAPDRPAGHVLLATVRLLDAGIDRIDDGRALWSVPNAAVVGLENFGSSDQFSDYPLSLTTDTTFPSGIITMWSGSIVSIPSGWVLCDGNNGTPDLQDKFVVGAGNTYSVDGTGGESTVQLTESELPSHNHNTSGDESPEASGGGFAYDAGPDNRTTNNTGGDSAHENKPPYHALAYIMKT